MLRLLAVLAAASLILCAPTLAQEATPPLLMLVNGEDIWRYDDAGMRALTTSGYVDRPAISPDGMRIAYKHVADIGIQALQVTGGLVSELPSDIALLDLTTGVVTPIAGQPEGATFNQGEPARAVVRSAPAWSPDGTALAWTEDIAPEAERHLVVHTLATNETRALVTDLPLQAGFQQTLPVRWGDGIALQSVTARAGDAGRNATDTTILIYNTDGTLRSSAVIQPAEGDFVYDFAWVDDNGTPKVGVISSAGRWSLIDPATGVVAPLAGSVEMFSLSAPEGLAVIFGVTSLPNAGNVFMWRVGDTVLPFTGPIEWLSVSPAGDAVAYSDQGAVYVWRDGQAEVVNATTAFNVSVADVVWGPVGWRTRP